MVTNGTGQPMNDNNKFYNYLPVIIKDEGVRAMISIPGSLSFVKLVMMSSIPAKSVGGGGGWCRYTSQDPFIHGFIQHCPIQSRLQSVLGVCSSMLNALIL